MMFVGAGMSKAFGVKTMPELYEEVKSRIGKEPDTEPLELIKKIEQELVFFYDSDEIDIEAVFSVLNGYSDVKSSVRDAGPFSAYLIAHSIVKTGAEIIDDIFVTDREKSMAGQLVEMVKKVISEECLKIDPAKVKKIYGGLFDVIPFDGPRLQLSNPDVRNQGQERSVLANSVIATTNYDLAVETYFRGMRQRLNDGFAFMEFDQLYYFSPPQIRAGMPLKLIKLHGSINWFLQEDGEIVQRIEEPSGREFFEQQKLAGKMMIYPMKEKYVSRDPFASLFGAFRKVLFDSDVKISIGYSFRDQAVNNAFSDAAKANPRFMLIIIDPAAEKISERVGVPSSKCVLIPYKIEDPRALEALKDLCEPFR